MTASLLLLAATTAAPADEALFRDRVGPLLQRRCLSCHNPDKRRGGLDLTTPAALLKGGDGGAVVAPGDAGRSRLLEMVGGDKPRMPKQGARLAPDEVALLRRWVEAGAAWPDGVKLTVPETVAEGAWWSLQPLSRPAVPAVKDRDWVRTPLDAFVL